MTWWLSSPRRCDISRLTWDQEDAYEIGVDRGVFYPPVGPGESWSGLISVKEAPTGQESTFWIDGAKSNRKNTRGEFSGSLSSFSYPSSFYDYILIPRRVKPFGLSYRVLTEGTYKLHLVYNVIFAPSAREYQQDAAVLYSWDFTALPVEVQGGWDTTFRTAHLVVSGDIAYSSAISDLEDVLYGTDSTDPYLPTPSEVLAIFEANSILQIIDNGDGTWTAIGPDDAITMLDPITFQIDWPSAVYIDANTYSIHSL